MVKRKVKGIITNLNRTEVEFEVERSPRNGLFSMARLKLLQLLLQSIDLQVYF